MCMCAFFLLFLEEGGGGGQWIQLYKCVQKSRNRDKCLGVQDI